jgi:antitoxin (DNA-binding transcriptional repressor) of toxin-antitoxin stability system
MICVNLHEAKARLSKYARLVKAGKTVTLCERNKPFAEIRPLPGAAKPRKRKLGLMKGLCPVGAEFFQADEAIAAMFNDGPVRPALAPPAKP